MLLISLNDNIIKLKYAHASASSALMKVEDFDTISQLLYELSP